MEADVPHDRKSDTKEKRSDNQERFTGHKIQHSSRDTFLRAPEVNLRTQTTWLRGTLKKNFNSVFWACWNLGPIHYSPTNLSNSQRRLVCEFHALKAAPHTLPLKLLGRWSDSACDLILRRCANHKRFGADSGPTSAPTQPETSNQMNHDFLARAIARSVEQNSDDSCTSVHNCMTDLLITSINFKNIHAQAFSNSSYSWPSCALPIFYFSVSSMKQYPWNWIVHSTILALSILCILGKHCH